MPKRIKLILTVLLAVVYMTASILPVFASSPAAPVKVSPEQLKLSPFKGIKSDQDVKKLLEKSITQQRGFSDIFSKLPYKGNSNAEKAEFAGVQYEYADGVEVIQSNTLASLNLEDNGNAPKTVNLGGRVFQAGTILVDEGAQRAVKLGGTTGQSGNATLADPTMSEVFKEFTIPLQTLHLKEGNIENTVVPYTVQPSSNFIDNQMKLKELKPIASESFSHNNLVALNTSDLSLLASCLRTADAQKYKKMGNTMLQFDFPGGELNAHTASGGTIKVRLDGNIKLGGMDVVGKYSMFDGYKFGLTCAEEISVKMTLMSQLNEEVYIPIIGLNIPFGIGGVKAGLFLIAGINGEMKIGLEVTEGLSVEAGVRGGTFFGVPTSIRPYFTPDCYVKFEPEFEGKVNGALYIAPVIEVRMLGMDVLRAELRLGGGIGAAVTEDGKDIDIDVDAILLARFTVVGKNITLLNKRWDLFSKRKKYTGIYKITIGERCAYRDLITGNIKKGSTSMDNVEKVTNDLSALFEPYANSQIKVIVSDNNGNTVKTQPVPTDAKGDFAIDFTKNQCDMKKGYTVKVRIEDKYDSESMECTFPFDQVKLEYADYFNDSLKGSVKEVEAKDAYGNTVRLSYNGPMAFYMTDGSRKGTILQNIQSINGEFAKSFAFKPNEAGFIKLVSEDGFTVDSNKEATSVDFDFRIVPVVFEDIEWPGGSILTSKSIPQKEKVYAKNIHEYVFLYVTLKNMRGTAAVVKDVTMDVSFAKFYFVGYPDWRFKEEIVPNTTRSYTLPLFFEEESKSRGIELYTYRWPNTGTSTNSPQTNANTPIVTSVKPQLPVVTNPGLGVSEKIKTIPTVPSTGKRIESPQKASEISLNIGPSLVEEISESWRIPDFAPNKAYWKNAIAPDFLDTGDEPIVWYGAAEYDQYIDLKAVAKVEHEGAPIYSDTLYLSQSGTGIRWPVLDAELIKAAAKEQLENEANTIPGIGSGMLEKELEKVKDKSVVTNPDDRRELNRMLAGQFNSKKYVNATISNEKSLPAWAAGAIKNMVAWDIMDLSGSKAFESDRKITQDEFASYISKAIGYTLEDSMFSRGTVLTGEKASVMLYGALSNAFSTETVNKAAKGTASFQGSASLSAASKEAVQKTVSIGVVNGFSNGNFAPAADITMAQAASMLNKVIETFILQ